MKESANKKQIDPTEFGLPKRLNLYRESPDCISIVIDRKSRIIVRDGEKIVANAKTIRKTLPGTKVMLKTSAPVCGKTTKMLTDHKIKIQSIESNGL